jgi:SAM-dependent methyltransferase
MKTIDKDRFINSTWSNKKYSLYKKYTFDDVDNYINMCPNNILDIGCGLAFESELFQKKYNCDLYLLDGEFSDTKNRNRHNMFGSADTMKFYSKISDLKHSWNLREMKYTFVDAENISIDVSTKFDVIYSFLSCGFHYPLDSYIETMKKHSHDNTFFIFTIRKEKNDKDLKDTDLYKIKDVIAKSTDYQTIDSMYKKEKYWTISIELK